MLKKCIPFFCLLLTAFAVNAASNAELERIMNAQGQLLTEYRRQLNDLQRELDALRGELQENSYKLQQTIERQKDILQQLDKGPTRASGGSSAASSSVSRDSTAVTTKPTGLADWSPTGNDKNDYNYIIGFVLQGKQTSSAITALQQFTKSYPKSAYQANANYWLGQLNYGQGKRSDASYYFAYVVKNYPKSAKAAESMLKIGLILLDQGDTEKAKAVLQQTITAYPNDAKVVQQAKQKLAKL